MPYYFLISSTPVIPTYDSQWKRNQIINFPFYKFSCAGCAACYVGETTRHFNTRVREHLKTDRASHIFKHLESSLACRSACSRDNFVTIDQASSRFALKIKEALHIFWDKPTLNAQVKHVNLKLSV